MTIFNVSINHIGDFFMNEKGLIQPEMFKKNYLWSELKGFSIEEEVMKFETESNQYSIHLSQEKLEEVMRFVEFNNIDFEPDFN